MPLVCCQTLCMWSEIWVEEGSACLENWGLSECCRASSPKNLGWQVLRRQRVQLWWESCTVAFPQISQPLALSSPEVFTGPSSLSAPEQASSLLCRPWFLLVLLSLFCSVLDVVWLLLVSLMIFMPVPWFRGQKCSLPSLPVPNPMPCPGLETLGRGGWEVSCPCSQNSLPFIQGSVVYSACLQDPFQMWRPGLMSSLGWSLLLLVVHADLDPKACAPGLLLRAFGRKVQEHNMGAGGNLRSSWLEAWRWPKGKSSSGVPRLRQ